MRLSKEYVAMRLRRMLPIACFAPISENAPQPQDDDVGSAQTVTTAQHADSASEDVQPHLLTA